MSKQPTKIRHPASTPRDWPLDKIIPYPNNPRTHPSDQIELLAKLITRHGVDQPIVVDEDGFILKGHGRRMAAVQAGMKTFPVVQHMGLSEDDKRAIRLADNQVALLSGWDQNLLRMELTDLKSAGYEMPLLGFNDVQLVSFMASVPSGEDPDKIPPIPPKPVTKLGDVWIMGKHRLLCGDSTRQVDVDKVLNGDSPNIMVTDPPYGVDYDPNWRNEASRWKGSNVKLGASAIGKVDNDGQSDWTESWTKFPGDVAYVWHAALHGASVESSLIAAGFIPRSQIIWDKGHLVIGRGDYHWQHEPCWYAVRKGRPGNWSGDRKQSTVWEIQKSQTSETGHGTQKPIECMRRPIQNNSKPGDYVYEPFSGSGTTLIACEMMTRYCLAIELNPVYVDLAVVRWQDFAKGEATLEGDGRTFAEIAKARLKGSGKAAGKKQAAPRSGRARSPASSPG